MTAVALVAVAPVVVAAVVVAVAVAAAGSGPVPRCPVPAGPAPARPVARPPSPVPVLGAGLRRLAGRRPDPGIDRSVGRIALTAVATAVVVPALAPVVVVVAAVRLTLRRRAEVRGRQRALLDELPDVVDLLRLAVGAGLTVPLAVAAVADRGTGAVAAALSRTLDAARLGVPLDDALGEVVPVVGEPVRPLVAALLAGLRDGVPVGPALDRVGAELRAERRRAAEIRARRLPVVLLGPLVGCVLPAFGLLTVVPVLVAALRALPT